VPQIMLLPHNSMSFYDHTSTEFLVSKLLISIYGFCQREFRVLFSIW
jgi:hypothetical protein